MFSVVVAGRLPLPAPQQVDETHAIFTLEDASSINHVVVFMTGQQAFPPGYAATVHLNWKSETEDKWLLLGGLKNDKPSAIFRIKGLTQKNTTSDSMTTGFSTPQSLQNSAVIGISIESSDDVERQLSALPSRNTETSNAFPSTESNLALVKPGLHNDAQSQAAAALAIAPRIAANIFSYLSSFAPDSAPQTMPLLKRWLEQFEKKIKTQGVGFLAREAE